MMKFTVITCTGDRPEAFALCEKYVSRQTLQPVQWIVLDDGKVPTTCTKGQEYYYVPEFQGRGSLVKKLRHAIEVVGIRGDAVAFFEDDDWYAEDWLKQCSTHLQSCDIYGEGRALYYNVSGRWWFAHDNMAHASLCATSFRRGVIPALLDEARRSEVPFIDVALWNKRVFSRRVDNPGQNRRTIGIKAMPGRLGYGSGHRESDPSAQQDPGMQMLRKLIGADADAYAQFYTVKNEPVQPIKTHSVTGQVHGPNWAKWLNKLRGKPGIVGAEIGTFKGESAEWMLDNIFTAPDSVYHCIDPFTGSVEHHVGGIDCDTLEQEARKRLTRFPNVRFHVGYSNEILRNWEKSLDFIYVDGAHDALNVLRDAVLVFEHLKPGGLMVFDDYEWAVFPNAVDRPKMAVDAFLACYAKELNVINRTGWQVCVEKK